MKVFARVTIILFTAMVCHFSVFSQGTIRGNLFDSDSGEPIIYGNVFLEGTTNGANSDLDGFFILTNIDPGTYVLTATYIGYDTVRTTVDVRNGAIEYQRMMMKENSVQLGVVNISAKREKARTEVQISKVSVTPKQIKALPSTGGEADIAQYIQVLPGVVSTGDQGGQIFIRGGSPIQNKMLLDGLTIYNPFHSIGFFSIFETEIIKNVDVLTGGFGAEYGGRISAIVDINTRPGNRKRFGGQVALNPFLAKAMVEGPIFKLKDTGGGSTSFVFTSKRSLIDQTSSNLYPNAAVSDSVGLPYVFNDTYGKLSFINGNGSKLNVFGFNYDDEFNSPDIANFNWHNFGGGVNFTLFPGNSDVVLGGVVGYSDYKVQMQEANEPPRESSVRGFNAEFDFTYFGNNSEVKYGFEFNGFSTDFRFQNPFKVILSQNQNTTELGGFVNYRKVYKGLVIEPGFRVQYYASLRNFSPEPRIGLKYNVSDKIRLKAAGGIYSQNLISTSNERDVVNLFNGFLSGPEEAILKPNSEEITNHNLQKSIQGVAGIELELFNNFEFNIETYTKQFTQLIIVNRNKLSNADPNYATETGNAFGVDFSMTFETAKWYVYSAYSWSKVNRNDGVQIYPTVFDRRHNVNFLATYSFGRKASWQASARWNLGTGFPFTKTQGFYNSLPFNNGVYTDYITSNPDNVGIIFSEERNGGRLPAYHRLDFSLSKKIEFSKYVNLEAVASVTNAYNRENIFYFDRVRYTRVNQLPILPSLGAKLNF